MKPTIISMMMMSRAVESDPYGDELVINGDFSNGLTGWKGFTGNSNALSINNEMLDIPFGNAVPSGAVFNYLINGLTGTNYRMTFDLVAGDIDIIRYSSSNGGYANLQTIDDAITGLTTYEYFFTSISDNFCMIFEVGAGSGLGATIDNVSIKKVL